MNEDEIFRTAVQNGMLRSMGAQSCFCITGTLSVTRKTMESLIEALGGSCQGAVGARTDFLIVGDKGEGTGKWEAATRNGTRILSEEEFCNLIVVTPSELRVAWN